MSEVSANEAAMRSARQEVCLSRFLVTGDMTKATEFADQVEKAYRGAVRAEVLDEITDRLARRATLYGDSRTVNEVIRDLDRLAEEGEAR